ncbi:MAG: lipid A biosynthesis lauroyl acyltransferase [Pseudomonadota bacterium]
MPSRPRHGRSKRRLIIDWLVAQLSFAGLWVLKALGPDRASALAASVMRFAGPKLGVHKVGQRNLALVFPDMAEEERERVLRAAWDNLGRTAAEYPHLGALYDFEYDPDLTFEEMNARATRIEAVGGQRFVDLALADGPAIIFTAHLGNWELPAVCAQAHDVKSTVLYRTPNNPFIAGYVRRQRAGVMGTLLPTNRQAIHGMAAVLERGEVFGLLVDQFYSTGVRVPFMGHVTPTNTIVPRLARQFDCPVHGVRSVRLPGGKFKIEITPALALPRDTDGRIDIAGSAEMINQVIEGWIREHPEQWLWFHRRWR